MTVLASVIRPSSIMARAWSSRLAVDHHVGLLDALAVVGHRCEPGGQVHVGALVGEARRVVDDTRNSRWEASSGLLDQLSRRRLGGRLALDIAQAGRHLPQLGVDRDPVLADQRDRPVVVRHDAHGLDGGPSRVRGRSRRERPPAPHRPGCACRSRPSMSSRMRNRRPRPQRRRSRADGLGFVDGEQVRPATLGGRAPHRRTRGTTAPAGWAGW